MEIITEQEQSFEQTESRREEIRAMYPDTYFPRPTMEPLWFGRRPTNLISDQKVLIDQNNGKVLSIVSDRYKVVHYEDVTDMVTNIVNTIKGYGQIQIVPRSLKEGQRFQIQLKFPEMQKSVKKLDNIIPKIEVFSSLDLSMKLIGRFGAFRQLCTNGMGVWELFKRFSRRHLVSLSLNDLGHTIDEGLGNFNNQIIEWKNWADQIVPLELYNGIWQHLPFSDHEKEKIEVLREIGSTKTIKEALPQKELTFWDLNNLLTQFVSHEIKSEIRKIDLEPEIARVIESTYHQAVLN